VVSILTLDEIAYSAVVNPETDHDTKRDGQLLKTNKCTTNFGRSDFGVVHGNDHRQ